MSLSFIRTVPDAGSMKPVIVRSVVVLPQPEGPRKVKNSPSLTCTFMSCRAVKSPNLTTISLSLIMIEAFQKNGGPDERSAIAIVRYYFF